MIRQPDAATHTPMMQQYFAAKEKYPEAVLFFRMGDFYEMFFEDAEIASEILGIALTSRSKEKDNPIPMAGIPVKALDSYLPKLLREGKRIAVCEQLQDPKETKGIVDRGVVRVITPGTITDEKLIGEKSNNYLASLQPHRDGFGLAWVDLTTGRFLVWESDDVAAVQTQIGRLAPAECLLPESVSFELESWPQLSDMLVDTFLTPFSDHHFEHRKARRTLLEHFDIRTLEGFGCESLKLGVRAGGSLLRYLQDTQKVSLSHLTRLQPFQARRVLPIDRATRRALELLETSREGERKGTLLASMDRTATSLGGRKLREWVLEPLTDVDEILARQNGVERFVEESTLREEIHGLLRCVHDLERIATRISYGSANARDLQSLRRTLEVLPRMRESLGNCDESLLRSILGRLDDLSGLGAALAEALVDEPPISVKDGGVIREGFHSELDELRVIATEGSQWFARYQHDESERTGIPSLKIGFNKVFGYYLEVTHTHRDKVPPEYVRKQTLKNAERFITPDLKEYENKVLHAKERASELEYSIFVELRDRCAAHIATLQDTANALAELDVLVNFARLAVERGYTRPAVNNGQRLFIEDGRHPVVEQVATTEPFIANSVDLSADGSIMIITGPNMAGKSTYIRQVAILTLLAQTGCWLPAKSAEIGVIDRLFTRVGASDDLTRGQSTFMVEMSETANILNNATSHSLVILDEVGRGTSTFDGLSLAWAITEHIADRIGARTLFATHYHELTEITRSFPIARNFNFAVKEWNDDIIFLRKVVEGGADKSYGIHVARLAGIPRSVLDRAKEILTNLESQALDLQDRPALAKSTRRAIPERGISGRGSSAGENGESERDAKAGGSPVQLDLFQGANDALLRELKSLETDSMTPLEALIYLAELRNRVV